MPPVFSGQLDSIAQERSGRVILLGVATCLAGIVLTGLAGTQKDKELGWFRVRLGVRGHPQQSSLAYDEKKIAFLNRRLDANYPRVRWK